MQRRTFLLYALAFPCSLSILSGCQLVPPRWPSSDIKELEKYIRFPHQPQQVRWQPISLPENTNERSLGPTDMIGAVAILTFDQQTIEIILKDAGPLPTDQSEISIFPHFAFDWYPQALKDHIVLSKDGTKRLVTVQGYSAQPFIKPSTENPRGSFTVRIPGTTDLFIYYRNWLDSSSPS